MGRRLASSRFRRRLGWGGALLVVAGGVALLVVFVGNTGHKEPEVFRAGEKPQLVPAAPKADPFTARERREVRAVAARFIQTAVFRRHVSESWGISTSTLHQGISRDDWANGQIPIVPYSGDAVAEVRWRVNYSYAKDVALKVAFYPRPNSGVERLVFDIELENHGSEASPKWLVSYWAPAGGPQLQEAQPGGPQQPVIGSGKPALGAAWLFAPIGIIVGGLLGVSIFLVVRGRLRRARAERLYRSTTIPS